MRTVNKNSVCDDFIQQLDKIELYRHECDRVFSGEKQYISYCYEHCIIMVYKVFEQFVMRIMIACLNHNHSYFEEMNNVKFGKHINDDVCEFLITKGNYFDFKGREGLCKELASTIGKDHNLAKVFKKDAYKETIIQLCALRNFAAHNSEKSKKEAAKAYGLQRIATAGSCLKQHNRFDRIVNELKTLANDIKATAME